MQFINAVDGVGFKIIYEIYKSKPLSGYAIPEWKMSFVICHALHVLEFYSIRFWHRQEFYWIFLPHMWAIKKLITYFIIIK